MTEVITEALADHDPATIGLMAGPNLAREVMAGHPSATCVAFRDLRYATDVQQRLGTDRFRVYTSSDVVGCEIGGAVKNVIAIAAGMADGLQYGMNTKAALVVRGLAELARLGTALGGDPLTFLGLAGAGDLMATCASPLSRNRSAGEQIARGWLLAELASTAGCMEGVNSVEAVLALAARHRRRNADLRDRGDRSGRHDNPARCRRPLMGRVPPSSSTTSEPVETDTSGDPAAPGDRPRQLTSAQPAGGPPGSSTTRTTSHATTVTLLERTS